MPKKLLLAVLFVTIILLLPSCDLSASNTANLSVVSLTTSSYPADIEGSVIIAKNLIVGNVNKPPSSGMQYWILKLSIKNKEYQSPITPNFGAGWVIVNSPSSNISPGFTSPNNDSQQTTISRGQTGAIMFYFEAPIELNPSNYQIRYIVQKPDSYGKLTYSKTVDYYDWNSQVVTTKPPTQSTTQAVLIPYGTYTAKVMGMSFSITLNKDSTYSMNDPVLGKSVGTYKVTESYLKLYDAGGGSPTVLVYQYVAQFKCLYIGEGNGQVAYYR
jgi:hypothetical protein